MKKLANLMKRWIVDTLEMICHGMIILSLLAGLVVGYQAGGFFGAVGGLLAAFLLSVLIFGVLFILLDISENLRETKKLLQNVQFT